MVRYLALAAALGVVFIIGFLLGSNAAGGTLSQIARGLKHSELAMQSLALEREFLAEAGCEAAKARIAQLSDQLAALGRVVGAEQAEKELGKYYRILKKKYHLQQLHVWLVYRRLVEECGLKANVVLFYFGRADPDSVQQGKILDELVARHGIFVFAIELGFAPELAFVESYYNISSTPSLIVNFKHKFEGLTSYEKLKEVLTG